MCSCGELRTADKRCPSVSRPNRPRASPEGVDERKNCLGEPFDHDLDPRELAASAWPGRGDIEQLIEHEPAFRRAHIGNAEKRREIAPSAPCARWTCSVGVLLGIEPQNCGGSPGRL